MLAFLFLGLAVTAVTDYFSDITLGFGGRIAYIPLAYYFCSAFSEVFRRFKSKTVEKNGEAAAEPDRTGKAANKQKACRFAAGALAAVMALSTVGYLFAERNFFMIKEEVSAFSVRDPQVLQEGPYKGLVCTEPFITVYGRILSDLDMIPKETSPPVYIAANIPFCYLYLDLPFSTYSTLLVYKDFPVRIERYWQLHPEKIPEYVYVPKFDFFTDTEQYKAYFLDKFNCEVTEGEMGYVLHCTSLR